MCETRQALSASPDNFKGVDFLVHTLFIRPPQPASFLSPPPPQPNTVPSRRKEKKFICRAIKTPETTTLKSMISLSTREITLLPMYSFKLPGRKKKREKNVENLFCKDKKNAKRKVIEIIYRLPLPSFCSLHSQWKQQEKKVVERLLAHDNLCDFAGNFLCCSRSSTINYQSIA